MNLEEKIIDYNHNKHDILHWVLLKGEYRYKKIIEFLENKSIPLTWTNITYYIKYDKRLLINSFKYFVFLEELFKSFIEKNKDIRISEINRYSFSKSLETFLEIDSIKEHLIDINFLKTEKDSIIEFRNSVVHNKILLGKTFKNKTLEEVLNIFKMVLPSSYKSGFIKDINNSSKNLTENYWHIHLEED